MAGNTNTTGKHGVFSGTKQKRLFGRYETLFRIAGGGMAEVYACRIGGEGGFEKILALKRMLPTLAEDERFVTMFLDEGRLAANISSPHVVQTMDLGRAEDDSLYLVMDLVVGVPLSQLIQGALNERKYIDPKIGTEILAQAAQGLHDAHEARTPIGDPLSIIHRDVSPQNILVDISGLTKITDFGVARAMQRLTHTRSGEVKGKMAYFAPEQATGRTLDRRVDVFALGIVAWETFAARRLFKAANPLKILQNVLRAPIPDLRTIRKDMPEGVAEAITKALQRDPDKRFSTTYEFAQALRAGVGERVPNSEITKYVQLYGGDSLKRLETELKNALEARESFPPPPNNFEDEATSVSTSTPGRSRAHTGSNLVIVPSEPPPAPNKIWPVVLAAVAVIAIGGGVGAWLFRPKTPVEPAQTTEINPVLDDVQRPNEAPAILVEDNDLPSDDASTEVVRHPPKTRGRGIKPKSSKGTKPPIKHVGADEKKSKDIPTATEKTDLDSNDGAKEDSDTREKNDEKRTKTAIVSDEEKKEVETQKTPDEENRADAKEDEPKKKRRGGTGNLRGLDDFEEALRSQ